MTREDVPAALEAIRSAPEAWLALPEHRDLRAWVLEERPEASSPPLAPGAMRRAKTG
jgi:hypothetical protein